MKVKITEKELQTLEKTKDGYTYSIMTRKGKLTVEGIPTIEDAIANAEMNLIKINKAMLKK
jgi:hypothetical protein